MLAGATLRGSAAHHYSRRCPSPGRDVFIDIMRSSSATFWKAGPAGVEEIGTRNCVISNSREFRRSARKVLREHIIDHAHIPRIARIGPVFFARPSVPPIPSCITDVQPRGIFVEVQEQRGSGAPHARPNHV